MDLTKIQTKIILDLGYRSPAQFLFHFPNRYEINENKAYQEWQIGDHIIFSGELLSPFRHVRFARNRSVTNFSVLFDDEEVQVSIFNRAFLKTIHYQNGITVTGVVQENNKVLAQTISKPEELNEITIKPVYPSKAKISQYSIRQLMKKILKQVELKDVIPVQIQHDRNLVSRQEAMNLIHNPQDIDTLNKGLRSIKYEEFLMYHLSHHYAQSFNLEGVSKGVRASHYAQELPFKLRRDQVEAYDLMLKDLNDNKTMHRLLQGDVGSGKTVVAFLTGLSMIEQGYQVAFMVPTELLLYQHAKSFKRLFPNVSMTLLNQASKKEDYTEIESGKSQFILGTHSLFQNQTTFKNLGLVIIDEQHRFGVEQREKLIKKGKDVDVLMLSATPIPQTLAHSLFMDLDVSTLTHSNKDKVETVFVRENSIQSIEPDIRSALNRNEQIYIVCPAIIEGERTGIKNVEDIYYHLSKEFNGYNVVMLHGKLNADDKAKILDDFSSGIVDMLISTSVIEVGIDVHNATQMIIYNAEQFGLATLHQMRGRVGRGEKSGVCYVLSSHDSEESIHRLESLVKYNDGFKLSEIDLKQRGMGDLLGSRQSGLPQFHLANIFDDLELLELTKKDARMLMENLSNYPVLKQHIQRLVENKKRSD